jgi:hypothetical protein
MQNFIFTRYLYEKDEVKLSLLMSILNKKNDAVFWANELYYSGFKDELKTFLWNIYYDFFATLNPAFNIYLLKQFKENDDNFAHLVENFMIRPFNLDVFMLRHQVKLFDVDYKADKKTFDVQNEDYTGLASYILDDILVADLDQYLVQAVDYFERKGIKIKKKFIEDYKKMKKAAVCSPRIILLSQILHLYSLDKKAKMGKNLYVSSDQINVLENMNSLRVYKILESACIYEIDSCDSISLFSLKREKNNIKDAYLNKWLYYAFETPYWKEKIEKYGGIKNDTKKEIEFNEENGDFDNFHNLYNYEPDEQKKTTQDKSIRTLIKSVTWKSFYNKYQTKGIINIEDEFLDEFESIVYF